MTAQVITPPFDSTDSKLAVQPELYYPAELYYPTDEEYQYLGPDIHDTLSQGASARRVNESPLWVNGFGRAGDGVLNRLTGPIDPYLDFLTPGQFMGYEGGDPMSVNRFSFSGAAGDMFQRNYAPAGAVIKAGPFYFDFVSVSGNLLYSSYSVDSPGKSDNGWIGMVDTQVRLLGQLTDSFFISANADIYLTTGGNVGFNFLNGGPIYLQLAYEREWGDWHFVLYDRLQILSEFLYGIGSDSYDRVGRFSFGRPDHLVRASSTFYGRGAFLQNVGGMSADRFITKDWKLRLGVQRTDSWGISGDTRNIDLTRIWTRIEHVGDNWCWHPYAEYALIGVDNFDWLLNYIYLGTTTWLTPEAFFHGRVGYAFSEGRSNDYNSFLFLASISHRFNECTSQNFRIGHDYVEDVYGEPYLATYGSYRITHSIMRGLQVFGGLQVGVLVDQDRHSRSADRELTQVHLGSIAQLTPRMALYGGYLFQRLNFMDNSRNSQQRHIIQTSLRYEISSDWIASTIYQHEHSNSRSRSLTYDEHLLLLRLTKLF